MNSICIAGNLTRDAEVRHMPNGDMVASFSVADNQGKDKPAIFWKCQLFGKRAESISPYLLRGGQVTVSGTVTEREYQKDGATLKAMEIRVNDVALQGGKRDAAPAPQRQAAPAAKKPIPAGGGGFEAMDDDVPFRDPMAYRGVHLAI